MGRIIVTVEIDHTMLRVSFNEMVQVADDTSFKKVLAAGGGA